MRVSLRTSTGYICVSIVTTRMVQESCNAISECLQEEPEKKYTAFNGSNSSWSCST